MWLKVYKTFRGGKSEDDYIKLPDDEKEQFYQDYAISWAEKTRGGENYGWIVHWEPVEYPPIEWLEAELRYSIHSLQSIVMARNKKILSLLEDIRCLKNTTQ